MIYFQPVCDPGEQGREPGGPNQTGSGASKVLHERDGMEMIDVTHISKEGSSMSCKGKDKAEIDSINSVAVQSIIPAPQRVNSVEFLKRLLEEINFKSFSLP